MEPVLSERPGLISCSGKRCYDHAGSKKLAKRMRQTQDKRVQAYHCIHCHSWHIGTSRPRQKILNGKRRTRNEDSTRGDQ
jgi:hypothetical protein